MIDHLYIFGSVIFTVYGQLILKWRIMQYGSFPAETSEKIKFLAFLFLDPVILSGFLAAFLASLSWMAAMTKFELSYAYPFMSLNFVLVLLLSSNLLGEPVTLYKIIGVTLIVLGTLVIAFKG